MRRIMLWSLTLLIGAASAWAGDGVQEINQTCAVQTGCFPGDAPAFPVTIDGSAGKSYELTSDLIVPDAGTNGITISAAYVGLDLNNFSIVRAGCENATTNCTPDAGSGFGVRGLGSHPGLSVRNGTIAGLGIGIDGTNAEMRGLRVLWNRLGGISASGAFRVEQNTVYQNGGFGIDASGEGVVRGNTVRLNGGKGIDAGGVGTNISGNAVSNNGDDGIDCGNGCTILGNTCHDNGSDANDHGIECSFGCLVRDNTVRGNSGFGLSLGSGSAYGANVITGNQAGTVSGGNNILLNVCDGPNEPQCP